MATSQILPFATGGGALVLSQADYVALAARTAGFQIGIADPAQLNKVWRQSAFVAAALAGALAEAGYDVLDDGDLSGLTAKIIAFNNTGGLVPYITLVEDPYQGVSVVVRGGESDLVGGPVAIEGGESLYDVGGAVVISGGTGATDGGSVAINGGDGVAASGGDVEITGGQALSPDDSGGSITITPGTNDGNTQGGSFTINTPSGSAWLQLDGDGQTLAGQLVATDFSTPSDNQLPTVQAVADEIAANATVGYRYSAPTGSAPSGTGDNSLIIGTDAVAEDADGVVVIGNGANLDNGTAGNAGGVNFCVAIGQFARIRGVNNAAAAQGAIAIGSAGSGSFNCDVNANGSGNVDGRQVAIGANAQIFSSGTGNVGNAIAIGGAAYIESTSASAAESIAISPNCTLDNARRALIIGGNAYLNSQNSIAIGYGANITNSGTLSNSGWNVVLGGDSCTMSGPNSYANVIIGGDNNTISTSTSSTNNGMLGGGGNSINGSGDNFYNAMLGGNSNVIGGSDVSYCAVWGRNHNVGSVASIVEAAMAGGNSASPTVSGSITLGSGQFSAAGDAQSGNATFRQQTTNGTPAELSYNAQTSNPCDYVTLPNNSTVAFDILVVARRTDADGENAAYTLRGLIKRDANAASTAIVGTVEKIILAENTAAWDVSATADTTNGRLAITATGEAAKTINWVANVRFSMTTG